MMKKLSNIIVAAAVSFMLTGCGLYNKYEKTVEEPADVFGSSTLGTSAPMDATIADLSWREFFTDPLLQNLIEQALSNNTDLNTARINIEKSQISLTTKKLAYLPSLYFSPQGSLYSFDGAKPTKSYTIPLDVSWDIDVFGSITNKKRAAKAALLQAQMTEESTRSNLISTIAQEYFYLQLLDRELEILIETDSLWKASLETMRTSLFNGCQPARVVVSRREVADCLYAPLHTCYRERDLQSAVHHPAAYRTYPLGSRSPVSLSHRRTTLIRGALLENRCASYDAGASPGHPTG